MRTERMRRKGARPGWILYGALITGVAGLPAQAQLKMDEHLSETGEYDSNVFRVSEQTAENDLGTRHRSDFISDTQAGVDVQYLLGQQRFYAGGDFDRYMYKHWNQLDRDEYQWLGGLDYKLGSEVDGNAEYKEQRHMVAEENRAIPSTTLDFETDRNAGGSFNLMVTPEWRVESRADWTEQNSPSTDAFFHYDETKYTLGGKYLGFGPISTGLQAQYLTGAYADGVQNGPYRQVNVDYTFDWKRGTLSDLTVLLGGSDRRGRDGSSQSFKGFTGEIDYKQALTVKTSLGASVFRRVQTDAVVGDYVAETGSSLNMNWQATGKIFVNLLGSYSSDKYTLSGRTDKLALAQLGLNYEPLTWLSLKPSVQYENRISNQALYGFADTVASLDVKLKF
jgi:hypothetical protein